MQIKEIRKYLAETIKHIRNNYQIYFEEDKQHDLMSDVGYSLALCDVLNKRKLRDYLLEKYEPYPT